MLIDSPTLIELSPCGEPYPCCHLSCDCEPGEFVTAKELLCRRAEEHARRHYHTDSTDDNDGS